MKANRTIKDTVYQNIMNSIISSEYKPNDIITERELIEKYGCSKSPVRDALIALCNEKVLISHPRYGYEVVRLTGDDIRNILEFRFALEGFLLEKSFSSITSDDLNELRRLDELCEQTLKESMWTHWEANTQFHLKLASFSHNTYALEQLSAAMTRLKRAYAQFYWENWTTATPNNDVRFHENIIQELEHGNVQKCISYLKDDLNDFGF